MPLQTLFTDYLLLKISFFLDKPTTKSFRRPCFPSTSLLENVNKSSLRKKNNHINLFLFNVSVLYLLKTPEMGTLARNGLKTTKPTIVA